jgi:hypothetical protein
MTQCSALSYKITFLSVCVCVSMYPPIVARQRFGRNVTEVTNAHATIEELLGTLILMWPVSYQGKSIARQRLGKDLLIVARQRLSRNVTGVMTTMR